MKQQQYIAQTSVTPENAKMVVDTIKDLSQINGFGLGVGLIGLIIIGYFGFILHKLIGKLDVAQAYREANEFATKTTTALDNLVSATTDLSARSSRSLNDIAEVTSGTDQKVDGIGRVLGEVRELQDKTVEMGREMSGKMSEIQQVAHDRGKEMSDRLAAIEQHLQEMERNRGKAIINN